MPFKIKIELEAHLDIQKGIEWYSQHQKKLGEKFYLAVISRIDTLAVNPHFEIRYDQIRCLPIKKFPFMIHFTVDESKNLVVIRAVFHTSLDPENWNKRFV